MNQIQGIISGPHPHPLLLKDEVIEKYLIRLRVIAPKRTEESSIVLSEQRFMIRHKAEHKNQKAHLCKGPEKPYKPTISPSFGNVKQEHRSKAGEQCRHGSSSDHRQHSLPPVFLGSWKSGDRCPKQALTFDHQRP